MADTTYTSTPFMSGGVIKAVITKYPPAARDPLLDTWYDAQGRDSTGVRIKPAMNGGYVKGFIYNLMYDAGDTMGGGYVTGTPLADPVIDGTTLGGGIVEGDVWGVPSQANWVWTSRIGHMDFDYDDSGETTRQPMPFSGYIYKIIKLGASAIVYGKNGVALMTPHGVAWGVKQIWPVGVWGKQCIADCGTHHYFIDSNARLCKVTEGGGITSIDYSNYFSSLSRLATMIYNPYEDIVYITDGTYGYALSQGGLGRCPANITGYGYKNNVVYATTTSGAITFDPVSIVTDTIDFETRQAKIIKEIEIGINATYDVYVAVDYRWNKADSFYTTPFVACNRYGQAFIFVSGIEFRIRVKQTTYEAIQIDYIKVTGETI